MITPGDAIGMALAYLAAMERRDMAAARALTADGQMEIVFPGGRRFTGIDQIVASSGSRYARIGKQITGRDAWASGDAMRVMLTGTLQGAWPDGTEFSGIRFIDWFEIAGTPPLIRRQHVWNDSAERLIEMQKEAK